MERDITPTRRAALYKGVSVRGCRLKRLTILQYIGQDQPFANRRPQGHLERIADRIGARGTASAKAEPFKHRLPPLGSPPPPHGLRRATSNRLPRRAGAGYRPPL